MAGVIDHLGRWLTWQTFLYPTSDVAVTHIRVWRWRRDRLRPMRPEEYRA